MTDIPVNPPAEGNPLGPSYASPATPYKADVFSDKGALGAAKAVQALKSATQGWLQTFIDMVPRATTSLDKMLGKIKDLRAQTGGTTRNWSALGAPTGTANVLGNGGIGNAPSAFKPITTLPNGGTVSMPNPAGWAGIPNGGTGGPSTGGRSIPPALNGPTGGGGGGLTPSAGQAAAGVNWAQLGVGVATTAAAGISRAATNMMPGLTAMNLVANQMALGTPGAYNNRQTARMMGLMNSRSFVGFNSASDLAGGIQSLYANMGAQMGTARFKSIQENVNSMSILSPGLGYTGSAQAIATLYSGQGISAFRSLGLATPIAAGGKQRSFQDLVNEATFSRTGQQLTQAQIVAGQQVGTGLSNTFARLFGGVGSDQYNAAFKYAIANAKWRQTHNGQNIDMTSGQQRRAAGLEDTVARSQQIKAEGSAHLQIDAYNSLAKSAQIFNEAVGKFQSAVAGSRVGKAAGTVTGAVMGVTHGISGVMGAASVVGNMLSAGLFGDGPGPHGDGGTASSSSSGDTINQLEKMVTSLGLPYTVTSTYRPGGNSYHARHEAIDIVAGNGPDSPEMMALDKAIAAKFGKGLSELIHAGPGAINIKDGKVVDGVGFYGSSTMAGHHNHVHVAASPQQLQNLGGLTGLPAATGTTSGSTSSSTAANTVASNMMGFLSEGTTTTESGTLGGLFNSVVASSNGGAQGNNTTNGGSQTNATNNGGQNTVSTTSAAGTAVSGSVIATIKQVATALGVPVPLALAQGYVESGLNPNRIGDQGTSFGIYQLHKGGELGSMSPSSVMGTSGVYQNAMTSLSVLANVLKQHPGIDPGTAAAMAQRPANQSAYAKAVDAAIPQFNSYATGGPSSPPQTMSIGPTPTSMVLTPPTKSAPAVVIQNLTIKVQQATQEEARKFVDMMMSEIESRQRLATLGSR